MKREELQLQTLCPASSTLHSVAFFLLSTAVVILEQTIIYYLFKLGIFSIAQISFGFFPSPLNGWHDRLWILDKRGRGGRATRRPLGFSKSVTDCQKYWFIFFVCHRIPFFPSLSSLWFLFEIENIGSRKYCDDKG